MQAHGAEIAYLFNLLADIGGRRIFSHAKGDLRANQGVMAMSREGASAPYWRYRSGSEKLTMSTSRTARRPTSVAPAIAIATLRFARFGLGKAAFAFLALTTTYLIKLNLVCVNGELESLFMRTL